MKIREYSQKLRDPRWQRRRLEVLAAADFSCESCGCKTKELHVHHPFYEKGKEPWQHEQLVCLCAGCHKSAGDAKTKILRSLSFLHPIELERFAAMLDYCVALNLETNRALGFDADRISIEPLLSAMSDHLRDF